MILPSIAALDIQLENLKSTCTLSFKKSAEKLKPLTPIPVQQTTDSKSLFIPNYIPLQDGNYQFQTRSEQSYHDSTCTLSHDPRVNCILVKDKLTCINATSPKISTLVHIRNNVVQGDLHWYLPCLLYTSPSPRD